MDINKVILIGRLVKDPETRILPSGVTVTSMRIAVNRKPTREGTVSADFFDVVAWRQLGELCARYLKKGQRIAVEGSLRLRSWQDQNGNYQSKIEIMAENIQFLEPKAQAQPREASQTQQPAEVESEETFSTSPEFEDAFEVLDKDFDFEPIDDLDNFSFEGGDSD